MFGRQFVNSTVRQFQKVIDAQLAVLNSLQQALEAQQQRIEGLDRLAAMHTQQIATLGQIFGMLGVALVSEGALSRDAAAAVRESVLEGIEPPENEGAHAMARFLDVWTNSSEPPAT